MSGEVDVGWSNIQTQSQKHESISEVTNPDGITIQEYKDHLHIQESTIRQRLSSERKKKVDDYLSRQLTQKSPMPAAQVDALRWKDRLRFFRGHEQTQSFWKNSVQEVNRKKTQMLLSGALRTRSTNNSFLSEEILTFLEQEGSPLIFDLQPAQRDFPKLEYRLISRVDALQTFAQLRNPLLALQRLRQLSGPMGDLLFLHADSVDILNRLTAIDETVFSNVVHVFDNQQAFTTLAVSDQRNSQHYHEDLEFIVSVCERGGFSPDEQEKLNIIKFHKQLFPDRYKDASITRVLEDYPKAAQEVLIASEMIRAYESAEKIRLLKNGYYVSEKKQILPKDVEDVFPIIESGEHPFDTTFVLLCIKYGVEISAQDFQDILEKHLEANKLQKVESANSSSSLDIRASARSYRADALQKFRFQKKKEILLSPRFEAIQLLAEADGASLTTDNLEQYSDLESALSGARKVFQKLTPSSSPEYMHFLNTIGVRKSEYPALAIEQKVRLILYKKIRTAGTTDTDFWHMLIKEPADSMNTQELERVRTFLLRMFSEELFTIQGKIDSNLLETGYADLSIQDPFLVRHLPDSVKPFYEFSVTLPQAFQEALAPHRDNFAILYPERKETPELLRIFLEKDPQLFYTQYLTKERLKTLLGEKQAEDFLRALPQRGDERRNAFTHNPYDRTTQFILYMKDSQKYPLSFHLQDDAPALITYIQKYGLARSDFLLYCHKLAYKQETNNEQSAFLQELGITSTEQLFIEYQQLQQVVMSEEHMGSAKIRELSPFQLRLLETATGKASHRFNDGRPLFDTIVSDYIYADEHNEITPLPEGYKSIQLELQEVTIAFDPTPIQSEFDTIRSEILDGIEHRGSPDALITELRMMLDRKIQEIAESIRKIPENKRAFLLQQQEKIQQSLELLRSTNDLDTMLRVMLDSQFGKAEQAQESSLKRKIILRKVFLHHFSPEYIQDLRQLLSGETTPAALLAVINITEELVKEHALKLTDSNQGAAKYWDSKTVEALKNAKSGKKLLEVFGDTHAKFKKAIDDFQVQQGEGKKQITAIPTRDLIGEMAGYLADVCYTKEYPLLKGRSVVPYKFITDNPETQQRELAGSVLIFEVQDTEGNPCLLVRGFDFQKETSVDVSKLIEQFLDQMEVLGKKLGKKKVLVPGTSGAISNYPMTIHHIYNTYAHQDKHVTLSETFDFNNYNITDNCYCARTIQ